MLKMNSLPYVKEARHGCSTAGLKCLHEQITEKGSRLMVVEVWGFGMKEAKIDCYVTEFIFSS